MEERFKNNVLESDIELIIDELYNYVSVIDDSEYMKDSIQENLIWLKDYLKIKQNNLEHQTVETPDLHRGDIVLVKFGQNIGSEFSGRHYGLVLRDCRKDIDTVLVLPITSQKPRLYDPKKKSIYIEIPRIKGFKGFKDEKNPNNPDTDKHWANILNIKNISRRRLIYPKKTYKLNNTKALDKISKTITSQIALRNL